jgi:hypothetical protein
MAAYSYCHCRVLAGALLAAVSALAAGCAGPAAGHAASPTHQATRAAVTSSAATSSPAGPSASPATTPSASPSVIPVPPPPGSLHQTMAFPSAHTPVFNAEMTDLWAAVTTGTAILAVQAFFPLTAYTQVKAIYDPAADWHNRLFEDYQLDVAAAHRFLGGKATLVQVIVPSAEAAWISPGVCSNSVGYWHVADARMVYQQNGQLRSIGIASLISWRGRWYVVHFGAVLRNGAYGVVDAPAAGPGVPGPPGGC